MGQNAEELRTTNPMTTGAGTDNASATTGGTTTPADIEATRASLSRDIDELTDKVNPTRVVERRKEAAKGRLGSIRDKVMGAAPDLGAVKSHVPESVGRSRTPLRARWTPSAPRRRATRWRPGSSPSGPGC
jgi:hypothetical protein